MLMEKGFNLSKGLKNFGKDCNVTNVSTGLICGLTFGLISVPLVLAAAATINLAPELVESWIFSIYFFGALVGIPLALGYQMPIAGAWSIPGIFAVAQVMTGFTINQAVGGFLISGVIVLLIGLSGMMKRIVSKIPAPILNAMVAGVLFKWATNIIGAFQEATILCLIGIVGYLVSLKFMKRVPPVLGTFIFGIIGAGALGLLKLENIVFGIGKPMFIAPVFTVQSIVSISIPLAVLVIAAENMQAYGVLKTEKYDAPINTMTILSGIGGLIAPLFGGHNANIAGPMTAFCSNEQAGEKDKRYVAAVFNGIAFGAFGLFAPLAISIIGILPAQLINLLVGLVLMGIIISALQNTFRSQKFVKGAFFSFVISLSGLTVLQIGSAFWAIVIGVIVSLLVERNDFKQEKEEDKEAVAS